MSTQLALDENQKPSTHEVVRSLKEQNQDHEWYPTTDEIIECVRNELIDSDSDNPSYYGTMLDIGAGDGRVLDKLTKGSKLAIEKSQLLIKQQDKDVITIGTDFLSQSLVDKSNIDVTFCNPPYSDFVAWSRKIIRESCSKTVFLVIPERWKSQTEITEAIRLREATYDVIGQFDFLEGDRKARAKVDVVKINMLGESDSSHDRYFRFNNDKPKVDPFELFFRESFKFSTDETESEKYEKAMDKDTVNNRARHEVAKGRNYIDVLEESYHAEMSRIYSLYTALTDVDSQVLKEVGIDEEKVSSSLKHRVKTLKSVYWSAFFVNFDKITERLTQKTRNDLLNILRERADVIDFSAANAHAIASWVIKNANNYFDTQLDSYMRSMLDGNSFKAYKSNQKTFENDGWRYGRSRFEFREEASHFKFDYRVVLTSFGGMDTRFCYGQPDRIEDLLAEFINDTLSIASTLGFDTSMTGRVSSFEHDWAPGQKRTFHYYNHTKEDWIPLFEIKAYLNGNSHIRFAPKFILALNVAMGRINGWLKTKEQAADELDANIKDVAACFSGVAKLGVNDLPALGHSQTH